MDIIKKIINLYKIPDDTPVNKDENEISQKYKKYRIDIFTSCFVGYTIFFHLTRKNYAVAMPAIVQDLHFTNVQLGLISSFMYFAFAIGKFVNGMIADRCDSKKIMPTALFMSSVANILFALSPVFLPSDVNIKAFPFLLIIMAFFWGINGWFQSMGFPVVAKSLTYWWAKSERGTVWSIWTSSHQLGTCVAFILAGFLVPKFGWQSAFIIPGVLNFLVCIYLYKHLYDKPSVMGLPDIEMYKDGKTEEEEKDDLNLSYFDILKKYIFSNKTLWLLALAFMFLNISRFGTEDWLIKYYHDTRGYMLAFASGILANLPLFGAIGTLFSGIFSDKINKGKRLPITFIFIIGLFISIYTLKTGTNRFTDILSVCGIGFFAAGPCMFLSGICAVETTSKKVSAAATGFCGIFGYIGAIASSIGTGWFIDHFGWNSAILFWMITIIIAFMILIPIIKKNI